MSVHELRNVKATQEPFKNFSRARCVILNDTGITLAEHGEGYESACLKVRHPLKDRSVFCVSLGDLSVIAEMFNIPTKQNVRLPPDTLGFKGYGVLSHKKLCNIHDTMIPVYSSQHSPADDDPSFKIIKLTAEETTNGCLNLVIITEREENGGVVRDTEAVTYRGSYSISWHTNKYPLDDIA